MASTCFGHLHVHLQEFLHTRFVSLPHVVLCPRCCGCGPTELVCSHVHCLSVSFQLWKLTDKQCTWLHTNSVGLQPQHLRHNTTCGSETNLVCKNSWRWTCKCPKHVETIYENKIIVKLFASSWYISLLNSDIFCILGKIICILLVFPVTALACEYEFSKINLIENKLGQ